MHLLLNEETTGFCRSLMMAKMCHSRYIESLNGAICICLHVQADKAKELGIIVREELGVKAAGPWLVVKDGLDSTPQHTTLDDI